jgi:exopolysaccharide biosynthesis protein
MRGCRLSMLVVLALLTAPCIAGDVWEDLMPGVRHLHRTTSMPWDIHVITIDLTNPRIDLRVGIKNDHSKPDAGETVRSICQRYNAVAGINCDFFAPAPDPNPQVGDHSHIPQGHCMTDGLAFLAPGHSSPIVPNRTTLQIPADNSYAVIGTVSTPGQWWWNVAAGGPRILRNGKVWGDPAYTWDPEGLSGLDSRNPRTGAAISQDWHTLILATVDGRQADSVGMTCAELGALLKEFGGYNGMNFDGGGSTTMVINGSTANDPSDGSDRRIANCLMVLDKLRQPASALVHYETGFENLPYPVGSLSGVDGWVGAGEITTGGRDGSQCARFSNATAYRHVTSGSVTGVQWMECYARVSSTSSTAHIQTTTADGAHVASAVRFGPGGQLEAYTTDELGVGYWAALGPYAADTWYRIHVRLDYNINTCQVFVNGVLKASGCAFQGSGAYTGLRAIRFQEDGGGVLCVDDVYVGTVDPDFLRVSPDSLTIVQGGRKLFRGVSGAAPVAWSVVEEKDQYGSVVPAGTVAQIDSSGLLTANAPGSCRVQAQDAGGRVDKSSTILVVARRPIATAKALADGANVAMSGLIVTGRFAGCIYAEEPDRGSGIKIITTKAISEGSLIYVTGALTTLNGERAIIAASLEAYPWVE